MLYFVCRRMLLLTGLDRTMN